MFRDFWFSFFSSLLLSVFETFIFPAPFFRGACHTIIPVQIVRQACPIALFYKRYTVGFITPIYRFLARLPELVGCRFPRDPDIVPLGAIQHFCAIS
jgi:hypothetical protein